MKKLVIIECLGMVVVSCFSIYRYNSNNNRMSVYSQKNELPIHVFGKFPKIYWKY